MLTTRTRESIKSGELEEWKCFGCGIVMIELCSSDIQIWSKDNEIIATEELCKECTEKIKNGKLKEITI